MKTELSKLRAYLSANGYDAFILPRADAYLGEYVAPRDEALAWLTGFQGSAGFALVTPTLASLYTDGRYQTQGAAEIKNSGFQLKHSGKDFWDKDLLETQPSGKLAFDPWLHSIEWHEHTAEKLRAGWTLAPVMPGPIDGLWKTRPDAPEGKAFLHPLKFSGESSADKCARLGQKLAAENIAAEIVNDPTLVAWLLNIRGSDLEFTPIAQCRAILYADASAELFIAPEKIFGIQLDKHITLRGPHELAPSIEKLKGKTVRLPAGSTPYALLHLAQNEGVEIDTKASVIIPARAIKNETEINGMCAAHARDGKVLTKLYAELKTSARGMTEYDIAIKIAAARQPAEHYAGESFPAIVGWQGNGAIVHYRPSESGSTKIAGDGILLIDCGAQYRDGTTDITRTLTIGAPTAWQREVYTRVLKGHLAIARAVFPVGTTGGQLDALARQYLWEAGLDYDHGTGHGVGCFLSVHEGPQRITNRPDKVALEPGMILSNEPGCYLPGEFGVRIENLVLVVPAAQPGFLCFETLTRVPYDVDLIDDKLLTPLEREQIAAYHAVIAK